MESGKGKQAWRYVNEEIYSRSTHLVKSNDWNPTITINRAC